VIISAPVHQQCLGAVAYIQIPKFHADTWNIDVFSLRIAFYPGTVGWHIPEGSMDDVATMYLPNEDGSKIARMDGPLEGLNSDVLGPLMRDAAGVAGQGGGANMLATSNDCFKFALTIANLGMYVCSAFSHTPTLCTLPTQGCCWGCTLHQAGTTLTICFAALSRCIPRVMLTCVYACAPLMTSSDDTGRQTGTES
jgi:hypothetical protein